MSIKLLSQLSYITDVMNMDLFIYLFKLNIKESKEINIVKAITDFWTMFPAQKICCWSRKRFPCRK